ncbi:tripartite tricarboxylate transporter TctB family protein [Mycobacterium sp. NAZ190054]|uniref:tripartite tricarboxylate transporter TctB family protein n=1 Tax=Mycobacterium sp. NAZ190054 TaxID=1747766 RepID=UPI00350EB33F
MMAVVGVAAMVASLGYGLTSERGGIGPGAIPFVAGLLLVVEGVFQCGIGFRGRDDDRSGATQGEYAGPRPVGGLVQGIALIAMLGLVVLLTPYVGLIPMTVLFGVAVGFFVEKASILASLLLGLISGTFIWVVFIALLEVRIPAIGPAG